MNRYIGGRLKLEGFLVFNDLFKVHVIAADNLQFSLNFSILYFYHIVGVEEEAPQFFA